MEEAVQQLTTNFGIAGLLLFFVGAGIAIAFKKLWDAYREETVKNASLTERLLIATNNSTNVQNDVARSIMAQADMLERVLDTLPRRRL